MQRLQSRLHKINQSEYRFKALHKSNTARWFVLDYEEGLFYYKDAADADKNWSGVTTLAMIDKAVLFKLDGQDIFGFTVWVKGAVHVEALCPSSTSRSSRVVAEEWVAELNRSRQSALQGEAESPGHPPQVSPRSGPSAKVSSRCQTEEKVKLTIIGDVNSGKTLLARNHVGEEYDGKTTIGVDFLVKRETVNGKQVKLQIYDTAGQEKFNRALSRVLYRESQIFFIVFDLSRQESFDSCPFWLQQARDHCGVDDPIMFLVGNKRDLVDRRRVNAESAASFARANGIEYFETSALLKASSLEYSKAASADGFERSIKNLDYLFVQALRYWDRTRPKAGLVESMTLDPGRNADVDEAAPQSCKC